MKITALAPSTQGKTRFVLPEDIIWVATEDPAAMWERLIQEMFGKSKGAA